MVNDRCVMKFSVGSVQLRILRVLWREGDATAKRITEAMQPEGEIAHSTVQTLLRKLEAKKLVAHRELDRVFHFRALVREDEVTGFVASDVVSRVFEGSLTGLVAHLINKKEVSDKELVELRALVDKHLKEEGE